jgi:hypothetical protein
MAVWYASNMVMGSLPCTAISKEFLLNPGKKFEKGKPLEQRVYQEIPTGLICITGFISTVIQ